jgi:zinc protease
VLYGAAHRYGTGGAGTAQSIQALTADDLRGFYAATYRPANAALLVVGDVTPDRAIPLLEASFGAWQGQAPPSRPALPAAAQQTVRQVYLVDKPGAPQSQIRIGWIGVPIDAGLLSDRGDEHHPRRSFSSRLNMNLRGGYYGAQSAFDMRAAAGPFYAAAGVRPRRPTP